MYISTFNERASLVYLCNMLTRGSVLIVSYYQMYILVITSFVIACVYVVCIIRDLGEVSGRVFL